MRRRPDGRPDLGGLRLDQNRQRRSAGEAIGRTELPVKIVELGDGWIVTFFTSADVNPKGTDELSEALVQYADDGIHYGTCHGFRLRNHPGEKPMTKPLDKMRRAVDIIFEELAAEE